MQACPICGSETRSYPARCSAFLADRIWGINPFDMQFRSCSSCGFSYYSPMLRQNEIKKLYAGYRSDEYQQQRQKHEPDYTPGVNAGLTYEELIRKRHITEVLKGRLIFEGIHSVLDYGGDAGQSIPAEFVNADKYVFDISNVPLLKGIKRCTKDTPKTFDYIQCCHVLEHVPDPHAVMETILQFSHQETNYYFEIPTEPQEVIAALKFFSTHRRLYRMYAKIFRKNPEGMFPVMHEHIMLFTPQAFRKLLEIHGLDIRYLETKGNVISCYAVRKVAI